jgi:DNA (cytosine-5)-methyltransferase 1
MELLALQALLKSAPVSVPALQAVWKTARPQPSCTEWPSGDTQVEYRGRLAADGPRYRALGNSMAVPVMRWIGQRIAAVHEIVSQRSL